MSSRYSTAILSGLRQCGVGADEIRRAARLSEVSLKAVAAGEREFADAELARIEKVAGKTIGQLGAMAIEPAGGEFSELMESWGEFSRISSHTKTAAPIRKSGRLPAVNGAAPSEAAFNASKTAHSAPTLSRAKSASRAAKPSNGVRSSHSLRSASGSRRI